MRTLLPPLATRDRAFSAILVVGCGIFQAAALAVAAFATRDAFAALHNHDPLALRTILELAFAGVIAGFCLFLSRRQAEDLGQSYAIALRRVLYKQIASLPKSRHDHRRTGALSLRFVGDLSAARLWFGRGLPDVLTAMVVLPGAVAILILLDAGLAFAALTPLTLSLMLMATLAWHLERRHQRLRKRRASIAISMIERIAIAPDLDLMGRTDKELRALDEQGTALKGDAVARRGRTAGLQAILQAGVAVAGLAILWFANQGNATPATVAASLSVLALVAMPLQDLGAAWDKFCAWTVAREKAQRLLDEPSLIRSAKKKQRPVAVTVSGAVNFTADAGKVTRIDATNARMLARIISGLDHDPDVKIVFGDQETPPPIAFIGDAHIGIQGSLRRTITLSTRKRPDDKQVANVLRAFGLGDLINAPRGLDQRLAENGKGLSAGQTLRLDLARAVLGKANVIVISSLRWDADPDQEALLTTLQRLSPATVILADGANRSKPVENSKAT
ncbi:MAG: ABC transporter ATP-binding protein [Pseudomonadota bacterium]